MANVGESVSVLPALTGSKYHIVRQDFLAICGGRLADAAVLRVFEQKTNQQIEAGRSAWISCSLREIAEWSVHLRSKSSFAAAMQRLMARGFIRRRFIARPGRHALPPLTSVQHDERGDYIVVGEDGTYTGSDGISHDARKEGWQMEKKRQYQLNVEEIAGELARLGGAEGIAERVPKKKKRGAEPIRETTTTGASARGEEPQSSARISNGRGGTRRPSRFSHLSLMNHDTIEKSLREASRREKGTDALDPVAEPLDEREEDDGEETLTADEVLELARYCGLKVPAKPVGKAGLAAWWDNWGKPAERLAQRAQSLWGGDMAETHLEAVIRYMTDPSSPSWWQTSRQKKTAITLRHISDNLAVQWSDLQAKKWRSPLMEPEPDAPEDVEAELERMAQRREAAGALSMPRDMFEQLAATIQAELPGVQLGYEEVQPGRYVIGVEYAPDQWIRIEHPVDYWNASEETAQLFQQAIAYGQQIVAEQTQARQEGVQ